MLDYKNENWWVYDLGLKICVVILIIVAVMLAISRKNLDNALITFILTKIQEIMLMIIFGLNGTEKVFAKNSKEGYSYYLLSFIMFANAMVSNFFN